MKITRVLTYNIDEDYIRNFYDEDWWKDYTEPDEIEYNCLIDAALNSEDYDDEEIIVNQDDKERMKQIWQEECDKYHKEQKQAKADTTKEKILDDIQYHKNMIAQLEKQLKDA